MNTSSETERPQRSRRRYSAEQRAEHVAAWQQSGQSAREYGRAHGLEAWQIYAWQGQQKRRNEVVRTEKAEGLPARFLSLSLSPRDLRSAGGATVTLRRGGMEFVVAGTCGPDEAAAFLRAIVREVPGV
jgi:transposase-like protein